MAYFGAHLSISGGLHKAVEAAAELDCDTVQLFTKNASQWKAKPLTDDEIGLFRQCITASGVKYPTAHGSYLINLAGPNEELWDRSLNACVDELERAEALGLSYLVMHPGAHMGSGEEAGLARVITAIDTIHQRCPGFAARVLIETTAGQGSTLGYCFEQIATILQGVREPERLGVCLDTCHVFAAGYPLASAEDHAILFQQFDETIGLKQLRLFHLNDSARPFNSRVDRHAGLGLGEIGLDCFQRIVRDKRFRNLPMILETPKENDAGEAMDRTNLQILRGFQSRKVKGGTT